MDYIKQVSVTGDVSALVNDVRSHVPLLLTLRTHLISAVGPEEI